MKHDREMFGGFPVSALENLPETEAFLVLCLRHWCNAETGPERVADMLTGRLGDSKGMACYASFKEMLDLFFRHSRRRLVRHDVNCDCVGADEAIFAHFVSTAATGEREDAMLIASLLIDARQLLPLSEAAKQVGLHLECYNITFYGKHELGNRIYH